MLFGDVFGSLETQPDQTAAFVKAWFHPDDQVLIVLIPTTTGGRGTLSMVLPARALASATVQDIEGLSRYQDGTYGLYMGVSPLREGHAVTAHRRGGKADVRAVYGVWADLDVKPGAFGSRAEIHEYLSGLALAPSIVVENGDNGGVHAYWKTDTPEAATTDLPARWWAYLVEQAGGRDIDRLADSSRIMRLPGAVYYPKGGEGRYGTVRVVESTGAVYTRAQIEGVCREAYEGYEARRAQTRSDHHQMRSTVPEQMLEILQRQDPDSWNLRVARALLEEKIKAMDWADILEPLGWTHIGNGEEGTRKWARPGQTGKSAHTDWNGSEVMSLHSWSEETGLADLKEADIPLTKEVVLLRLKYNNNVAAMVTDLSN